MQGAAVRLRVDRDGLQSQFPASTQYANRDFAPIGHEHFLEHAVSPMGFPAIRRYSGTLPCFRGGFEFALVLEHLEGVDQPWPRFVWFDHIVDKPALRRDVRICEFLTILGYQLGLAHDRIAGLLNFLTRDDIYGALGAHHRDLGAGPRQVYVAANVLRRHHAVGPAVRFARYHGQFWHCCLAVGVQELGARANYAMVLLVCAWQEAWNIFESDKRNIERVAEAHETGAFLAGINVQHPGKDHRLISDDSNGMSGEAGKAHHDVRREVLVDLEELTTIGNAVDDLPDVIWLVCGRRNQCIQFRIHT